VPSVSTIVSGKKNDQNPCNQMALPENFSSSGTKGWLFQRDTTNQGWMRINLIPTRSWHFNEVKICYRQQTRVAISLCSNCRQSREMVSVRTTYTGNYFFLITKKRRFKCGLFAGKFYTSAIKRLPSNLTPTGITLTLRPASVRI